MMEDGTEVAVSDEGRQNWDVLKTGDENQKRRGDKAQKRTWEVSRRSQGRWEQCSPAPRRRVSLSNRRARRQGR